VSDVAEESWTDTHCHLQDHFADRGVALEAQLDNARAAGVRRAVCVGTDAATSRAAVALARQEADRGAPLALWSSVGLHPHEAEHGTAEVAALLDEVMAVQGPTRRPGSVVAVGECGLDYYYEHSGRHAQRLAFTEQIALAARYDLTLVVHTRDAFDETIELLGDAPARHRVVIHCFTGGPDDGARLVAAGCFLSFSGIVTFKNAEPIREALRRCPAEAVLVETDSPFLAPVPFRGRPNEPAHVSVVGAAVAEIRHEPVDAVAKWTSDNAVRAFALEP
jgi:TatD DNase family protein